MREILAKKYVNALIKSSEDEELENIHSLLKEISQAFISEKFHNIIMSPDILRAKKAEFILSLVEQDDSRFVNLIKLLAQNERLNLIPAIAEELKYKISLKKNVYEGEVISNFEIGDEQISKLEENFSKKFDSSIKLNKVVSDYPGVKIQLDDLGVEVSFSLERLKTQMAEHILKAI